MAIQVASCKIGIAELESHAVQLVGLLAHAAHVVLQLAHVCPSCRRNSPMGQANVQVLVLESNSA
jgi:hypothetical protein